MNTSIVFKYTLGGNCVAFIISSFKHFFFFFFLIQVLWQPDSRIWCLIYMSGLSVALGPCQLLTKDCSLPAAFPSNLTEVSGPSGIVDSPLFSTLHLPCGAMGAGQWQNSQGMLKGARWDLMSRGAESAMPVFMQDQPVARSISC